MSNSKGSHNTRNENNIPSNNIDAPIIITSQSPVPIQPIMNNEYPNNNYYQYYCDTTNYFGPSTPYTYETSINNINDMYSNYPINSYSFNNNSIDDSFNDDNKSNENAVKLNPAPSPPFCNNKSWFKQDYGELASNKKCSQKQSRIGDKYQAIIPDLVDRSNNNINNNNNNDNNNGNIHDNNNECSTETLLWEPNKVSKNDLDYYLNCLKKIFGVKKNDKLNSSEFDYEKGLYLLKLCNYNVNATINLLLFKKIKNNDYLDDSDDMSDDISTENDDNMDINTITNIDYDDADYCYACTDGGSLIICDYSDCGKVWHPGCVNLNKIPKDTWYCPHHFCCICSKESSIKSTCNYCPNSYCTIHIPNECKNYTEKDIEFLCQSCIEQDVHQNTPEKINHNINSITNNNNNNNNRTNTDEYHARSRMETRLTELHKRKCHRTIPDDCLLGKYHIHWYSLYKHVILNGGLHTFDNLSKWDIIINKLNLDSNKYSNETHWNSLQNQYITYLYIYDIEYSLYKHKLPSNLQNLVDKFGVINHIKSR